MGVYRNLLRFSGCDPYHSTYNHDGLDETTTKDMSPHDSKYFIVSLNRSTIKDAQYWCLDANQYYREQTGKCEDYGSLSEFISEFINEGCSEFEDVSDRWKQEIDETPKSELGGE